MKASEQTHTWTADQVLDVLERTRHAGDEWLFLRELRLGTGYSRDNCDQRMDAWVMHFWPSKSNISIAYEVKVTRSDFRHEIRKPAKRKHALLWSNRFSFVAPSGVIPHAEVPPECGLIEVSGSPDSAKLHTAIAAPVRDCMWPTWLFFASVCRRLRTNHEESRLRTMVRNAEKRIELLEPRAAREIVLSRLLKRFASEDREAFRRLVGLVDEKERETLADSVSARYDWEPLYKVVWGTGDV